MTDANQASCAHTRIEYLTISGNGLTRSEWRCADCLVDFAPKMPWAFAPAVRGVSPVFCGVCGTTYMGGTFHSCSDVPTTSSTGGVSRCLECGQPRWVSGLHVCSGTGKP